MAGSPGGKEVGRVSVRVVPDTSKFRRQVERDLKRDLKGLKVEVKVVPDMKGFREKVQAHTKGLSAKVRVEVDKEQLQNVVPSRTAAIKTDIEVDTAKAQARIREFEARNRIKLHAQIELDRAKTENKSRLMAEKVKAQLDLDTARAQAKMAAFKAKNGKLNVDVDVDKSKLQKVTSMFAKIGDYVGDKLNRNTGMLGALGGGGDVSQLLLILAVVLLIAPAISVVATLLAGLPALIAGAGLAFGALYLGAEGFMRAFEKITPQFKALKAIVSDEVFKQFSPVFDSLMGAATKLGPEIRDLAGSFGFMAGAVARVLTSGSGLQMVGTIMRNMTGFIQQMAPVMGQFTKTFLQLGKIGSESFGTLAATFNDFALRFQAFTTKMEGGVLAKAFEGLRVALDGFGKLFFDLMEVGVQGMARMGPILGQWFSDIGAMVKSLFPFFETLSTVFMRTTGALMRNLAPALNALAPVFTKLGDGIARFAEGVFNTLGPVLETIASTISEGLLVALNALQPVLEPLVATMEKFGVAFQAAFEKDKDKISKAFSDLATAMGPVSERLAEMLPQLLQIGLDAFPKIVEALPELIASFLELGSSGAIPAVTDALIMLAPHLPTIVMGLTKIAIFGAQVTAMFTTMVSGLAQAGAAIAGWFSKVLGWARGWVSAMIKIPVEIVQGFINAFTNGGGLISNVLEGIWNGLIASAKGILGIHSPSTVFNQIGVDLIQGLINGIKSMLSAALSAIQSLAGSIVSAAKNALKIHSPSRVFIEIGGDINAGLAKGLKDTEYQSVEQAKKGAQNAIDAYKREWIKEHRKKGEKNPKYAGPEFEIKVKPKSMDAKTRDEMKRTFEKDLKKIPVDFAKSWVDSLTSDLGIGTDGAIGNLVEQLFDPKLKIEDQKDVYIVKDVQDAERRSQQKQTKNALRVMGAGAGRGM